VESINLCVSSLSSFGDAVPLFFKGLEIVMHVLLKLTDRLSAEGVRYRLALATVLCSVPSIEKAPLDGDKCIIVFALRYIRTCILYISKIHVPLQETISMAVDLLDCLVVGHRNMMRLNSHQLAVLLVGCING